MDLTEARKNLDLSLSEDQLKKYFNLLTQLFTNINPITKREFYAEVRKLLLNQEQIRCHNYFMLALYAKRTPCKSKSARTNYEKGGFECADIIDYVQPTSPSMLAPLNYENRTAASELFMPDSVFISTRVAVTTWEHGLDGADDAVIDLVVQACQVFVKNILTAMVSKKKGYKVRDNKLQYAFNFPVPDPFIKNYNNIVDDTQDSKVEVLKNEDKFLPKCKPSMEVAEQRVAFAYACAKRKSCENPSDYVLSVRLLYDTIKENPRILGSHELQSVNLLKLSFQLEDSCV